MPIRSLIAALMNMLITIAATMPGMKALAKLRPFYAGCPAVGNRRDTLSAIYTTDYHATARGERTALFPKEQRQENSPAMLETSCGPAGMPWRCGLSIGNRFLRPYGQDRACHEQSVREHFQRRR
jgi:hypothetical protein